VGALLDTSVLIHLERRTRESGSAFGQSFASLLQNVLGPDEPVAIAAITASELLHGVHRATLQHRPRREAFVEAILSAIPTVPFDLRAARTHARVWAELAASGSDIGPHDRLIAASALSLGWKVVTTNVRHFTSIAGLEVVAQWGET
jgi:tRNA(fMet)-specific endonuclease VapC